jgi:phosphatidyl-myo-inositol dimannoside synthase
MTVLVFSYNYWACGGGISRLCREIVAAWRARGTSVVVLRQPDPHAEESETRPDAAEICVAAGWGWREMAAFRALRRMRSARAVVCRIWYPEGLLAWLAGVRPRVILAHGSELTPAQSLWRRGLRRWLMRVVCETADLVVANSEYTRRMVLGGSPRATVVALPLGVDHERFCPVGREEARRRLGLDGKVVISSVSRLRAYKGHDTVLKAMAGLSAAEREGLVYLVAGRGPHQPVLRSEAQRLGVSSNVRWLGFVSEQDLPDVYRASDLFVLCTREAQQRQEVEGFGLVFLEAQACGTPVVGTRCGGIPEAIREGEGGWLIDQDDAGGLTRILSDLVRDPSRFRAAGLAARRRVERECTWRHYLARLTAILEAKGIPIA